MSKNRSEALLREYAEVSSTFRMLTDIRFKLLAFLPVAAAAAAAVVAGQHPSAATLAFATFGLAVTVGLVSYNSRNDQLYDALVGRAAAIERSLGLPDGAFANRPRAWLRFGAWNVDHRTAVASIYYASAGLWLFEVLDALAEIASDGLFGRPASTWLHLAMFAGAVVLLTVVARIVRWHRKSAEQALRGAAVEAVGLVMRHELVWLMNNPDFRRSCSVLAGINDGDRRRRWWWHERPEDDAKQVQTDPFRHVAARIQYLTKLEPGAISHFIDAGSAQWTAAQTVAALTDLTPGWLYDCATSRRRHISPPATTWPAARRD